MIDEQRLIIESMERVREKRSERIANLSHEAQRLTDWREHVRAAPLAAVTASVLIGSIGVSKLLNRSTSKLRRTDSVTPSVFSPPIEHRSALTYVLDTATAFAIPLLTSAFQKQLKALMQTCINTRSKHDEKPTESN